ncbi:MAG: YwmB family TATA-box binding protein [Syntrophomonas sp.]
MRKMLMYIMIFIILCSFANFSIDYSIEKEIEKRSPYYLCFASIGAISLESRIDCWVKINTTTTSQDLKQNVLNFLQIIKFPVQSGNLQWEKKQDTTLLCAKISKENKICTIIAGSDNSRNESYYNITIISKEKEADLQEYEKALKKYTDFKWTCYYQYTGLLPGMENKESRDKIISIVMKNLKAQKIECYEENQLTSVTGYSKFINHIVPGISASGKKYNVQTVLRTDGEQGKTYVYIASPLILGDY